MKEDKVREAMDLLSIYDASFPSNAVNAYKLLDEALAPEPKFYMDQPVLVSDDGENWIKRYFARMDGLLFACYFDGRSNLSENMIKGWEYCKPDPDARSIINWIEHDGGENPVNSDVIVHVHYSKGRVIHELYNNGYANISTHITWEYVERYFIVDTPEYL